MKEQARKGSRETDPTPSASLLGAKHADLLLERATTLGHVEALSRRLAEIDADIFHVIAAARLFGEELPLPPGRRVATGPTKRVAGAPVVRAYVLAALRAQIAGVKASTLTHDYQANYAASLHPKTMGMTLYRLAIDGLARREGRTWFATEQEGI